MNPIAQSHQAANYSVRVRTQDGALVGEVLRDGVVVWTSPVTAQEDRARALAWDHVGTLCGLGDVARH